MQIVIDFRSAEPIYVQIVEQVRRLVASSALKPGDQLPTVRQLATELRVNFNTVARAYRLLDEAGLISTQQGRGTYIWETQPAEIGERLRRQTLQDLTRGFLEQAARLGYDIAEISAAFQSELINRRENQPEER